MNPSSQPRVGRLKCSHSAEREAGQAARKCPENMRVCSWHGDVKEKSLTQFDGGRSDKLANS